jgi:hypothetical protein
LPVLRVSAKPATRSLLIWGGGKVGLTSLHSPCYHAIEDYLRMQNTYLDH